MRTKKVVGNAKNKLKTEKNACFRFQERTLHLIWPLPMKKKRMQSVKAFDYGKFFSLSLISPIDSWWLEWNFGSQVRAAIIGSIVLIFEHQTSDSIKKNLQKSRKKSFSFSFGEQKNGDRFTRIEWVVQFGCWLYALVFAHSVYVHFFLWPIHKIIAQKHYAHVRTNRKIVMEIKISLREVLVECTSTLNCPSKQV